MGLEVRRSTPRVSNSGLKDIHQSDGFSVPPGSNPSEEVYSADGGDNPTMEQVRKRAKWDNDDYVCRCLILNGMYDSLFDIYQNVDTFKEIWDTLEAKYIAEDASSKKFLDNDKLKGNNVVGPLVVNIVEHNNSSRYIDNRGKRKHHDTKADPNKEFKVTCWKMMMLHGGLTQEQLYMCVKIDGSILHVENESTALVHGRGCVDLRLGHVHFKRMQDMSKDGLIPAFNMDIEKCKTCMLTRITKKPFQNVKRETEVLELIHSDLCDLHATPSLGNKKYFATFIDDASRTDRGGPSQGFWGEAMFCYLLNKVPSKRNRMTPYELWTKRKPNLRVWGCRAVVRLPDPKLKTLGERGIECIFVGYAEHSKAFSPETKSESLKDRTEYIRSSVVPEKIIEEVVQQPEPELRKSKRNRTLKSFGPEFQLYLIEGTRDLISDQHSYCFNVEDDPKIFNEAMKSQDVSFWKESINNEMDSIMENNTWVLADLPPSFLNGELEEEVYMNQRQGFIMPGNENKVCKRIKSLYTLKHAPKQWHQKIDKVVLSNGYLLNQADKYVYSKFDKSGKGVIICLYVDDILIFGTDQVQVDLTKEFLSSRFSMKDMGG
ncbi:zinc finger, CCHC-type containing protein [Tanacetum coccineum]